MSEPSVRLWVKYTIFFLNILFLVLGGVLLFVGIWGIYSSSAESITAISEQIGISLDPFYAFLIFGAVVFLIALAGAIGSLRENVCLLKTYSGILIFFLLLEIALAVLVYLFQDRATKALATIIDETIKDYNDNADKQYLIDLMQENLKCCGVNGPNDWQDNIYYNCSSLAASRCSVPFSCCILDPADNGVPNYQCGYGVLGEPESDWYMYIFTRGCVEALKGIFLDNAVLFGIIGGVMIISQVVVIGLAHMIIDDIKLVTSRW